MDLSKFEQIADYAWIKKGIKYWNLWEGNPFCIQKFQIPIDKMSKNEIIIEVRRHQEIERERFQNEFNDVPWVCFS